MPISHEHKIIFIHVPKCAGTTIEDIFGMRTFDNFYCEIITNDVLKKIPYENFTDEEYRNCAVKNMQHYTFRELSKVLKKDILNTYKKIAVVRNPYDRLVSEYHFCELGIKKGKTFEEFVEINLKLEPYLRNWLFDGHLETQTSFLMNDAGNFNSIDKIYRFEGLNACLEELKIIANNFTNYHGWKSVRKETEYYYNEKLKKAVFDFYKEDFINFNYPVNFT